MVQTQCARRAAISLPVKARYPPAREFEGVYIRHGSHHSSGLKARANAKCEVEMCGSHVISPFSIIVIKRNQFISSPPSYSFVSPKKELSDCPSSPGMLGSASATHSLSTSGSLATTRRSPHIAPECRRSGRTTQLWCCALLCANQTQPAFRSPLLAPECRRSEEINTVMALRPTLRKSHSASSLLT